MALFKIAKKLEVIKEKPFILEKEIQSLTEENLPAVLGLKFVKSEFAINKFRIDTLAFDSESKAFVIIEYKRDKNFSVIDQGYAYLSLMLNNKADFILEYNESQNETLKEMTLTGRSQEFFLYLPALLHTKEKRLILKTCLLSYGK